MRRLLFLVLAGWGAGVACGHSERPFHDPNPGAGGTQPGAGGAQPGAGGAAPGAGGTAGASGRGGNPSGGGGMAANEGGTTFAEGGIAGDGGMAPGTGGSGPTDAGQPNVEGGAPSGGASQGGSSSAGEAGTTGEAGAPGCTPDQCSNVASLAAGLWHTCARFKDGNVKCWGSNYNGVLGLGDTTDRGWQIGSMGDALPFVQLGGATTALFAGGYMSCALLENAKLVCWGANTYGVLGEGNLANRGDGPNEMGAQLPAVDLGSGRTAKQVAMGLVHACAVLNDGSVKCWGENNHGQLGYGDTVRRDDAPGAMGNALPTVSLGSGRSARVVRGGHLHTCALLDDSTIECWGYNGQGQLGVGDTIDRGIVANQMGDTLPAVNLGTSARAIDVVAGGRHSCALLDSGVVKCWGGSPNGELGQGNKASLGVNVAQLGDALPAVPLGSGRKAIALMATGEDSSHTCARLDNGTLKCWGENTFGELGLGDTNHRGDAVGEMGDSLPAVDVGTGLHALQVVGGQEHTCALLDDDSVRCWGEGWLLGLANGVQGSGLVTKHGDAPGEMGDALHAIDF